MIRWNKFEIKNDKTLGALLVLPIIIWLVVVFLYPFLNTFYFSMTDQRLIGSNANFVGLATFWNILIQEDFWIALYNTMVWTVSSVTLQVLLALMAALLLNQQFWGRNFFRTWIILPWAIPYSVIAVIARWMCSSTFGVINWVLIQIGLISEPLNFLGSLDLAMITSIMVNVWKWFPFVAVTYLAVLQGIPEELYEAARIDGCNVWQEFIYVTLPSLRISIGTTTLLMTFWNFNTFGLNWLLTAGGPATATTTLPILVYKKAFQSFRMGEASGLSVLMFIILLVYTIFYNKLTQKEKV